MHNLQEISRKCTCLCWGGCIKPDLMSSKSTPYTINDTSKLFDIIGPHPKTHLQRLSKFVWRAVLQVFPIHQGPSFLPDISLTPSHQQFDRHNDLFNGWLSTCMNIFTTAVSKLSLCCCKWICGSNPEYLGDDYFHSNSDYRGDCYFLFQKRKKDLGWMLELNTETRKQNDVTIGMESMK